MHIWEEFGSLGRAFVFIPSACENPVFGFSQEIGFCFGGTDKGTGKELVDNTVQPFAASYSGIQ